MHSVLLVYLLVTKRELEAVEKEYINSTYELQ